MFENNPFVTHTLEILIMLLGAFFIGLWLGWVLWGKLKVALDRLKVDNQSLNVTLDAIRLEIEALKTRAVVAESDNSNYATQILNLNRENVSLREKTTYLETELAEALTRNRQVETELGLSFPADQPETENLILEIEDGNTNQPVLVEPLDIPLEINTPEPIETPTVTEPELPTPPVLVIEPVVVPEPKPEKAPKQKAAATAEGSPTPVSSTDRDDLTVVEGIGPKIQMLLNQYGIFTYRQLAEADVTRLKEILSTAGPQLAMHDPGTWPSQANLAANDQWDTLKSVQGFLKGGKKPD